MITKLTLKTISFLPDLLFDRVEKYANESFSMFLGCWEQGTSYENLLTLNLIKKSDFHVRLSFDGIYDAYFPKISSPVLNAENENFSAIYDLVFNQGPIEFNLFAQMLASDLCETVGLFNEVTLTDLKLIDKLTVGSNLAVINIKNNLNDHVFQGFGKKDHLLKMIDLIRFGDQTHIKSYERICDYITIDFKVGFWSKILRSNVLQLGAVIRLESELTDPNEGLSITAVANNMQVHGYLSCDRSGPGFVFSELKGLDMEQEVANTAVDFSNELYQLDFDIGHVKLTIGQLSTLTPGDIHQLTDSTFPYVNVLLQGNKIAKGELVTIKDKFAVQIIEVFGDGQ